MAICKSLIMRQFGLCCRSDLRPRARAQPRRLKLEVKLCERPAAWADKDRYKDAVERFLRPLGPELSQYKFQVLCLVSLRGQQAIVSLAQLYRSCTEDARSGSVLFLVLSRSRLPIHARNPYRSSVVQPELLPSIADSCVGKVPGR